MLRSYPFSVSSNAANIASISSTVTALIESSMCICICIYVSYCRGVCVCVGVHGCMYVCVCIHM